MELAMYDSKMKVEKKKRRNECYWQYMGKELIKLCIKRNREFRKLKIKKEYRKRAIFNYIKAS